MQESIFLRLDIIGWGLSKISAMIIHQNSIVRQYTPANNGALAGDDPA